MTKQDLLQLESLLEKFSESYGETINNGRYVSLRVMAETVNGTILEGKYEKEERV